MVLYTSAFPNSFLQTLHSLAWALIFPCYWLTDRLLVSFLPTTYEKHQRGDDPCYLRALCLTIIIPICLALLIASLPFALIGFVIWAPLQSARRPYVYSRFEEKSEAGMVTGPSNWKAAGGRSFCFATANVCLLPDSLARFTNLSNTQIRSCEVGKRIRNGASRPQIKIYIDSPTNTSISAASWSSLACPQGGENVNRANSASIRRTSSMDYKGDNFIGNCSEDGKDSKHGWEQNDGDSNSCIVRISGDEATQFPSKEVDTSGVQVTITEPAEQLAENESEEEKCQTPNHKQREGDVVSLDSNTASRESLIKFRIADGAMESSGAPTNKFVYKASVMKKASLKKKRHLGDTFDHELSAFFPANLDFLCLQEVFDKRAAEKLKAQLNPYFQYILYDVGRYAWHSCCSFKFLNSGLFFASRYPILDVEFKCYPNGKGDDSLADKGALFVKVQVGTTPQDQRIVGYVSCTHLQALAGDAAIRCEQMDHLLDWLAEFQKSTSSASPSNPEDLLAFDVLLGDLNFDNCSSEDKLEQQHSLFTHYKDPCRLGPGEEQPWVIGTLMDPEGLYDEDTITPDNLQKVLESEEGRREYLVFANCKNHPSSQKGRKVPLKSGGRRIDYALYSEDGLNPDWKVEMEEFSFVTQLAGLTDHLAVAMRLSVSMGEEDP
ncbi:sphingomyelin phosphodiesterase 3 [Scyliorhinus canicula]|uniref:sphingomyelin phosphodiesterase 3 n=1 Tax=Scyliorhinus canicula TaxID=7830 RepID=UPI0018F6A7B1|nr:sphingomyelin phosphodiesterase 3 [Scyliorhinus canicula]XP_038662875.1 sphingomyelin phosphodiesterase 3 [Scyliorhinus canicula]XP_038662876.1 sphingomyelin phosphodiesterase 3 [Scyliorhinus canicula]